MIQCGPSCEMSDWWMHCKHWNLLLSPLVESQWLSIGVAFKPSVFNRFPPPPPIHSGNLYNWKHSFKGEVNYDVVTFIHSKGKLDKAIILKPSKITGGNVLSESNFRQDLQIALIRARPLLRLRGCDIKNITKNRELTILETHTQCANIFKIACIALHTWSTQNQTGHLINNRSVQAVTATVRRN